MIKLFTAFLATMLLAGCTPRIESKWIKTLRIC